jgi:hypothetical protein
MHKLVQEALRYRLSIKDLSCRNQKDTIQGVLNGSEIYFTGLAIRIIPDVFPKPKRKMWPHCEKYLTHAITVGDWAEVCEMELKISELFS